MKQYLKRILPKSARVLLRRKLRRYRPLEADYYGLTNREVFEKIYREGVWGFSNAEGRRFFSGSGSHHEGIVSGYVIAVREFLAEFDEKPKVADLGCGDFNVGSQLAPYASSYMACDIVEDVISENEKFFDLCNVEFRVLDLVNDELPLVDVIFVRQVLQHLSNDDILSFVKKVSESCRFLVATEHLPSDVKFRANLDKPSGPGNRLSIGSGVLLTKPPFNLNPKREKVLCEFEESGGSIRTFLYEIGITAVE